MSPDHWSKLTWDTVSAGGYDLFGPIGYLDRIRDRACKQRVIVTQSDLGSNVYNVYGRESGEYTYVSDAHNTTSWLDHVLCSHDMNTKLSSLRILNKFPSSDHLPMSIYLHFDHPIEELVTNSCSRDKVTINWSKASDCDILYYRNLTYNYLHKLNIQSAMKCTDINCKSFDHYEKIDTLYSQICNVLRQSSIESVPSSKIHDRRHYIVPGFNEFAKSCIVLLVMRI